MDHPPVTCNHLVTSDLTRSRTFHCDSLRREFVTCKVKLPAWLISFNFRAKSSWRKKNKNKNKNKEEATATIIAYFPQLIINNLFGSRNALDSFRLVAFSLHFTPSNCIYEIQNVSTHTHVLGAAHFGIYFFF